MSDWRTQVCPECRDQKHVNCTTELLIDDDRLVRCRCAACHPA